MKKMLKLFLVAVMCLSVVACGQSSKDDDIEVKDVRKFEQDYLSYLKSSGLGILEEIAEKKAISDDLTNKMKSALETFKKQFTA